MIDVVLTFLKDNPEVVALISIPAALLTTYIGIKILGKDLIWILKQTEKAKPLAMAVSSIMIKRWRAVYRSAIVARTKGARTGNRLWFRFARRRKMHIKFNGILKSSLTTSVPPNERAHAALVNSYLKPAMDEYLSNGTSPLLTVTPTIHGLLSEARGLSDRGYQVWVAVIAGELVLDPHTYAENGYTVPWAGVSAPFLRRVWRLDDPESATDPDETT